MLYLIRDRDYLKIGYSANVDQRKKAYETTNCYAEIIMIKEGSRKDEAELHNLCKKWQYKNEWFYYDEEIIKIFEEYKPSNEQRIATLEQEIKKLQDTIDVIKHEVKTLQYLAIHNDKILEQWVSEFNNLNDTCGELLDKYTKCV